MLFYKGKLKQKSLRFQFIFWTSLSFAFTTLISFIISGFLFFNLIDSQVKREADIVSERFSTSVSSFIWSHDGDGIMKMISAELENDMVQAIHVKFIYNGSVTPNPGNSTIMQNMWGVKELFNNSTKIVIGRNSELSSLKNIPNYLKKTSPVYLLDNKIAEVDVYMTTANAYKTLIKGTLIFSINMILMFMSLIFIMLYLLNSVFLSRLHDLLDSLKEILESDKIIPAKLQIAEDNEFGDVRLKINEVQDKFRATITSSLRNERAATVALENLKNVQQSLIQSEKMAALGGVVAGVAHELNTPLGNSLIAVSTVIAHNQEFKKLFDENKLTKTSLTQFMSRVDEGLKISFDSSQRAASLVEKFKQVAVDQTNDRIRTFTISSIVGEALSILNSILKKSKAKIVLDIDPELSLTSYPGGMYQILSNLIANAVIHGLDGKPGHVIISASIVDGSMQIQVRDDGKGISPLNLSKIFDPFFTTTFGKGGSGLGLHIAQNEALKMKGRLSVESEVGFGTTFTLTIDLDDQPTLPAPL